MEHLHIETQVKQLLRRGYSAKDVRHMVTAPEATLDRIISEHQQDRQIACSQHNQASYAMQLGNPR